MIKVISMESRKTAYTKKISFTYEGMNYLAILSWNEWDGYELTFTDSRGSYLSAPTWAQKYEEDTGDSLAFCLDSLSDELLVTA